MENTEPLTLDTPHTDSSLIVVPGSGAWMNSDSAKMLSANSNQDSLVSIGTVPLQDGEGIGTSSWTPYLAVGGGAVLVVLLVVAIAYRKAVKNKTSQNVWGEVFDDASPQSMEEAKKLLKKLKAELHPDRFVSAEAEMMQAAEQMFQKLNESKYSLSELKRIQSEARELGLIST